MKHFPEAPYPPVRHHGRVVRKQIHIAAAPERVWQAWADPQKLSQWLTDGARGQVSTGGDYVWLWEDFDIEVPYRVLAAEPPRRLLLETSLPDGGESLLEIEVRGCEEGTFTRVTQSGLSSPEGLDEEVAAQAHAEAADVASGWEMALALLKLYAERYFGRPKHSRFLARPADFREESLAPYFHRPAQLSQWLTAEGAIGQRGQFYGVTLKGGQRASGRVLSDTGREVALSWREIDGVLELKAFQAGPEEKVLGLRLTSWAEKDPEPLVFVLHEALDRLVDGHFRPVYGFPE